MDQGKYRRMLSEYQLVLKRAKIRYLVSSNSTFALVLIFVPTAVLLSHSGWLIGDRGKVAGWLIIGCILASFIFRFTYKPFAGLSEFEYTLLSEEWSDNEAASLISMRVSYLNSDIAVRSGQDFVRVLYGRMGEDGAKSLYVSLSERERQWVSPPKEVKTSE